ncbi:MAG: acetate--CoA ligase [Acidobacteria bacterium]|nr:acetate--CoA ligase [Acidobacteriota bacterium]
MTEFAWTPGPEQLERANVARLMRAHGISDYWDLVRRSQEDPEWFWDAVVRDLGIEFFMPYSKVLDASGGIPWAKWFTGGTINLTHNCVDRHAARTPGRVAIRWEGEDGATRTLSYAELRREVDRLAGGLCGLGIGPGDAVGIFMPMIPENAIAIYACSKIGAVWLPIFSGFAGGAVASRLQDAEAKVLITADGFLRRGSVVPMKEAADEAVAASPTVRHVIVHRRLGREDPWTEGRDLDWADLVAGQPEERPAPPLDSEHPLLIAYTSGTTGRPKGAVHVQAGFLVKIAEEVAYQVDLRPDDTLFWVTDMGWIMGPWELIGANAAGGCVLFYEGAPDYPASDRLWEVIERHRATILGASPTLIRALIPRGEENVRKHDLSSLRILGSTGEPWNPEPWRWFFEVVGGRRCPVINLSGGTEVGACFLSPTPLVKLRPCTLGGPALGMAIDVYDQSGKPLPPGQVGELVCTKPWPGMTRGIWRDPERYIETYWSRWPDVWVHGDWASRDADGYWYLHGRSDDTLKIAGKRLGPAEVESILVSHPAVAESAVVGVPDEVKGEKVWCFVVLRPGTEPTDALRAELRALVERDLGKAFRPDAVRFVGALPRTRSAKILRRTIRAVALGEDPGDLSSLENPGSLDEIRAAR